MNLFNFKDCHILLDHPDKELSGDKSDAIGSTSTILIVMAILIVFFILMVLVYRRLVNF